MRSSAGTISGFLPGCHEPLQGPLSERVFVDTNIFVYADDAAAKVKRPRARAVLSELIRERRAVVSTQVMQEYFVTAVKV